jgi:hypothetical protein
VTDRELIEGVTLRIGRRDYVVPPLNLKGVKRAQKLVPMLGNEGDPVSIDAALEIVHLAVTRNYPEVTVEQLEEDIDLGNLMAIVQAVLSLAGFTAPKATGETAAAGD